MKILVVGTGDMAHALCSQWNKMHSDDATGYHRINVASATREFVPGSTFHATEVEFIDFKQGIQEADVAILAIPQKAIAVIVEENADALKDTIVVDVTNDRFNEQIQVFNKYNIRWVKAFNDVGAIDLLSRKTNMRPRTRLSGGDASTVDEAKKFAEDLLGFDVQVIRHEKRKATEQDSIGKEWKHAAYIAIGFYAIFTMIYAINYYHTWPFPMPGYDWPTTINNKGMSSTSMALFALSVIPGTYARLVRSWNYEDSMYSFHPNVIWALSIRKHLGLIGMFFLFIHAVFSLIHMSPQKYYWCFYDGFDSPTLNLTGEVSLMFATISTALFIVVAITSLPSVGHACNKAQWNFVFGPVIWLALAFGHVHYCMIYFRHIQGTMKIYGNIPHATLLSSLIPWFAFLLKFIQMVSSRSLPTVRRMLNVEPITNNTTHSGSIRHLSKHKQIDILTERDETER